MRIRVPKWLRMPVRDRSGMRPSERAWRRGKPKGRAPGGQPMTYARRVGIYYRQNGAERLTPAQRRRVWHKVNAGRI